MLLEVRNDLSSPRELLMNAIIVSDDEHRDSAVETFAAILSNSGDTRPYDLSELLKASGLHVDSDGILKVNEYERARFIDGTSESSIFNRAVTIGVRTAKAVDDGRDLVTPNLLFAAYCELLAACPTVYGKPGVNSSVGDLLPLNLQWRSLGHRLPNLKTPDFLYGLGAEFVDTSSFKRPFTKSIFDVYDWEPMVDDGHATLHRFVVDYPKGNPAILYFVGSESDAFSLSGNPGLSEASRASLRGYQASISEAFKAFAGEALFFVDDDGSITFAAFSHYLKTSVGHRQFASIVSRGLAPCRA